MGERADLSLNRRRGALLGLAVGDALGAAVEFMSPGSFEPVSDYRGGGAHGLAPGEWTDDTSMALALADGIAERGWICTIRPSAISRGGRPGCTR